jgi:hypothetical protein
MRLSAHQFILDAAPHEPLQHGDYPTSYGLGLSGNLPSITVNPYFVPNLAILQLFLAGRDAA